MASVRSNDPVINSNNRFEPVIDVPNIVIITTTPGRNHWSVPSPRPCPVVPASRGPKRPRKTSGWIRENTRENGSRTIVSVSRHHTWAVSVTKLRRAGVVIVGRVISSVLMRLPLLLAGSGR